MPFVVIALIVGLVGGYFYRGCPLDVAIRKSLAEQREKKV